MSLLLLALASIIGPESAHAARKCDVVFSAGNAYADGVGDHAANLLMMQETIKRFGPGKKYCLVVSPEPEKFYTIRRGSEPGYDSELAKQEYRARRYEKARKFLALGEAESGALKVNSVDVPWFTEEAARKAGLHGKIGVIASLFPESDSSLGKENGPFIQRFREFADEVIGTQDYGYSSGQIKSFQSMDYSVSGGSGIAIPTGGESRLFYFFDAFPNAVPPPPAAQFEVLVNANVGIRTVDNAELSSFLRFAFDAAEGRPVHIKYVTEAERPILENLLQGGSFESFAGKSYVLEPAFPARLSFFEFQRTLPRYRAVFSGGLTLGTMSINLGIPTFFQSLPHLRGSMQHFRKEVGARLAHEGELSDLEIARTMEKKGRVLSRKAVLGEDSNANIFSEVEKKIRLVENDPRQLPLSLKEIDPQAEGADKIRAFLGKLGCP